MGADVRGKERLRRNKWQLAVLLLVLLVQCFYISQKSGYHMDELLTFELANAEYNPWIVPTQPVGRLAKFMQQEIYEDSLGDTLGNIWDTVVDVLQNRGASKLLSYKADVYEQPVWISREQFHEYITVGERDGFNYLSVYFNVKDDNHPPLYFMLVHTLSSLFRDRISPWMGCVFNLAAVLGCCILLFALGRLLAACRYVQAETGERWGLGSALLYGCSCGAIATTVFIRMYGVLTFFCMLSLYLHLRKWLGAQAGTGENFMKKNKALILVTALGFWTQYFFLFYCLLLALATAILLFRGGRRKETFCYMRSMVIAAAVGVAVYPFGVKHIFSSGRGVEAIGNLMSGLSGYGERLLAFGRILWERTLGLRPVGTAVVAVLLVIGTVLALWKCRKTCAKRGGDRGPDRNDAARGGDQGSDPSGTVRGEDQGSDQSDTACGGVGRRARRRLAWLLVFPPAGYFLLAARMSPYMVDRYIMPVFPFAAMALTGILLYLWSRLGPAGESSVLWALLAVSCVSVFTYDGEYLYKGYGTQLGMARELSSLPCVCVYEGYGFYDNLLEFQTYDRTLLVKPSELAGREDIAELPEVIVLCKQNVEDTETVWETLAGYGLRQKSWVIRENGVYGDIVAHFVNDSLQGETPEAPAQ